LDISDRIAGRAGIFRHPQSPLMPDLLIKMTKHADGSAVLRCERPDGSATWQRQTGRQGRFFPVHDLTHYAVETVLGHQRGFYGLVAEGWNVTDFGAPWARGKIPADADPSELIVGFFDAERASGSDWCTDDLNESLRIHDPAGRWPRVSAEQVARIRGVLADLKQRWVDLAPGHTLALDFTRGAGRIEPAAR
jgi:hypothetical protein